MRNAQHAASPVIQLGTPVGVPGYCAPRVRGAHVGRPLQSPRSVQLREQLRVQLWVKLWGKVWVQLWGKVWTGW